MPADAAAQPGEEHKPFWGRVSWEVVGGMADHGLRLPAQRLARENSTSRLFAMHVQRQDPMQCMS